MSELYVLKIDQPLKKSELNHLLKHVPKEQRKRIDRLSLFENKQSSLLAVLLARYTICQMSGLFNKDLIFGRNPYGKPVLLNPCGIYFNLSHSNNWVVCAADNHPIGIDVEVIRPVNFNIAKRFFSKNEYNMLLAQPDDLRLRYFFQLWTLKESYIKAEGKGLSIALNSFTVSITDNGIDLATDSPTNKYDLYQTFLTTDTVCAVCTQSGFFKNNLFVHQIDKNVLLDSFN